MFGIKLCESSCNCLSCMLIKKSWNGNHLPDLLKAWCGGLRQAKFKHKIAINRLLLLSNGQVSGDEANVTCLLQTCRISTCTLLTTGRTLDNSLVRQQQAL